MRAKYKNINTNLYSSNSFTAHTPSGHLSHLWTTVQDTNIQFTDHSNLFQPKFTSVQGFTLNDGIKMGYPPLKSRRLDQNVVITQKWCEIPPWLPSDQKLHGRSIKTRNSWPWMTLNSRYASISTLKSANFTLFRGNCKEISENGLLVSAAKIWPRNTSCCRDFFIFLGRWHYQGPLIQWARAQGPRAPEGPRATNM